MFDEIKVKLKKQILRAVQKIFTSSINQTFKNDEFQIIFSVSTNPGVAKSTSEMA